MLSLSTMAQGTAFHGSAALLPLFAAVIGISPAKPHRGPIILSPCRVENVAEELKCGTLDVPEDRTIRNGRTISLRIVVLPATGPSATSDPVVYLVGGPGQAATTAVAGLTRRPIRQERDIVLVDQRGTGGSNSLACAETGNDDDVKSYFRSLFDRSAVAECRKVLTPRADLRAYSAAAFIEDLEAIREGLGYKQFNLWGISGGSRVAMEYAFAHPDAIRSIVLAGVVPPQFKNPLQHARSADDAIRRLFAACRAEVACNSAFPDLDAKLDSVLHRLAVKPVEATVLHPVTQQPAQVTLTRDAVAEGLRATMYGSPQARFIPALVQAAYDGNFTPSATFALARARALRGSIATGVLLGITCGEDVSRITQQEIEPQTRGTYLGDSRVLMQIAACQEWGPVSPPSILLHPPVSSVPALMLSGDFDPVTPPQWADSASRFFPRTLRVHMNGGHAPSNACTDALVHEFFVLGNSSGLDITCASRVTLPAFATMQELQAIGKAR